MAIEFDLLRELTETSGVPGYEDRLRDVVRREFDGVVDEVRSDAMGNLVGTVEGATSGEVFQHLGDTIPSRATKHLDALEGETLEKVDDVYFPIDEEEGER